MTKQKGSARARVRRTRTAAAQSARSRKTPSGIAGFDQMTVGGLPRERTTLLVGGPGSGKTIFGMQFLVHGARTLDEPGIFVAFEESPDRLIANFDGFGWDIPTLQRDRLFFIDARPTPDLVQSGSFDLAGLLAVLEAKAKAMGARRIVLDAIDVMLDLLPDEATRRRELYRVHEWLLASRLTGLITAKATATSGDPAERQPLGYMQFMVDCAVMLNHTVCLGVSQRNLRVQKYRGTGFNEDEAPFVIGSDGFDVAISRTLGRVDARVSVERISSG